MEDCIVTEIKAQSFEGLTEKASCPIVWYCMNGLYLSIELVDKSATLVKNLGRGEEKIKMTTMLEGTVACTNKAVKTILSMLFFNHL